MAQVDKKFIIEMQGKQFILYDGLLDMAHQMGLVELTPEIVKLEKDCVVFKATAVTMDGEMIRKFTGHGDATPDNVNRMIKPHMIRMAETRAKARALRDLTNIGMCSVEELGGDDHASTEQAPSKPKKASPDQLKQIKNRAEEVGVAKDDLVTMAEDMFGVKSSKDLTPEQAVALDAKLIERLEGVNA